MRRLGGQADARGVTSQTAGTGTGGKPQGPLPSLLLVLTVVTGVVDAVSILRLGRVFVANMTGNVVFSAFAGRGAGVLAQRFARRAGRALLVLHAGTAPALGLATGLLAMVTAGAALAVRRPGPWRAG